MKKKLIFRMLPFGIKKCLSSILFMCLVSTFASAQTWNPDGDNSCTGSLTVGNEADSTYSSIRLMGPNRPFGIASKREFMFSFNGAGSAGLRAYRGGEYDTYLQFLTSQLGRGEELRVGMVLDGRGNVGIGQDWANSNYRLDVNGKILAHGGIVVDSGYVGIGTLTPAHELDVNGTIRAKEVLVESDWADYVFANDYKLPALNEVKSYIKDNGHLSGVPSAEEVKKTGIGVGTSTAMLLQKIEELTLYAIQQQEEIQLMKSKIEKMEKQ